MNQNMKIGLIVSGVIIMVLVILSLALGLNSGWHGGSWGMMGPGMMGGFGWMWLMPLFMIVFWGLIIWGVIAVVRNLNAAKRADSSNADSALDMLKKRYAKGEIGKEEFDEKKRDLA